MIKWLPLLCIMLIGVLIGCEAPVVEMHQGEEHEEEAPVLTLQEALGKMPCFECHSVERFFGKPQTGVFSHLLHENFGLHCNQCHEVRGHSKPKIFASTCSNCHALTSFTYPGGGMGQVQFNHEFHSMVAGCRDCHPDNFLMRKGATGMTMDAMYQGKQCGACHNGQMAFASTDCTRCHKG
jgi:c(7)-type cytochrome triheme protein